MRRKLSALLVAGILMLSLVFVACDKPAKTVAVTGVSMNKAMTEITEGNSEKLIATVLPVDATDKSVSFTSSNASVATVDSDGTVKALTDGTTDRKSVV